MVLAEGIARYQPFVTEEVTRVTGSWAGLRTFAPDSVPCSRTGPPVPGFRLDRRSGRLRVPDRTSREPARRRAYRGARTCPAGRYRRGAAPRPAEVRAVGRRVTRSETHHSGGKSHDILTVRRRPAPFRPRGTAQPRRDRARACAARPRQRARARDRVGQRGACHPLRLRPAGAALAADRSPTRRSAPPSPRGSPPRAAPISTRRARSMSRNPAGRWTRRRPIWSSS